MNHRMSVISMTKTRSKIGKYSYELHKKIGMMWSGAIMAFVRTAALGDGMHIETGMSAASLLPVLDKAQFRGVTRFRASTESEIRSHITKEVVNGGTSPDGVYHPASSGFRRSFEQGIKEGKLGTKVSYGSTARPLFQFHYAIQPYQWQINENDWGVLEVAQRAFIDYVEANIPTIFGDNDLLEALTPEFEIR